MFWWALMLLIGGVAAKSVENEFLRFKRSDIVTRYVTDTDARALLLSQGVNITSVGNCNDKTNSQCTSLDGVTESALNSVIDLRVRSMCSVVVNCGTENGNDAEHLQGKALRVIGNDCIDKFINGQMVRIADRQDLGVAEIQYQEQATNDRYVKLQDNDWDIYVA